MKSTSFQSGASALKRRAVCYFGFAIAIGAFQICIDLGVARAELIDKGITTLDTDTSTI